MARSRNIKPGFFKNYDLADTGPYVQVLFAGLWCLADREGRLEDKPRFIKAELFPYYDFDVNGGLTELERLKFICRYTADGMAIIQVLNFKKHQSPHNTEKASVLPFMEFTMEINTLKTDAYDNNAKSTVISPLDNDGNLPDSLLLIPDCLIPNSLISRKTESKHVDPEKPNPEKSLTEIDMLKNAGICGQLAKDFLRIRRAKKAPVTQTAIDGIVKEAEIAGISIEEAVRICINRNWQGFNAGWDWQPKQSGQVRGAKQPAQRIDYGEYEPSDFKFNEFKSIQGERLT